MALALFDDPDSPNCRKVRLLLSWLGLPYRTRRVDLRAGQTRSPEFLAVNPRGQIPVLADGDLVLTESNAILLYLAERHAPELCGRDPLRRARVAEWLFWQSSGVSSHIAAVGYQRVIRPLQGAAPELAKLGAEQASFARQLSPLERHLASRDYLADTFSVADIALGAWFEVASRLELLSEAPAIQRWLARLVEQDFWQRAPDLELFGPRLSLAPLSHHQQGVVP